MRDVSALAALPSLQTLYLDGTAVREGSLEHLATHSALSALSVAGISVADGNNVLQIISGELRMLCVCTAGVFKSGPQGLQYCCLIDLKSLIFQSPFTLFSQVQSPITGEDYCIC